MPFNEVVGLLTDIGTEELAHMEMICAIIHQLTRDLTPEQIEWLHDNGKMPDWAYYQQNGKSAQENFNLQRRKILAEIEQREAERRKREQEAQERKKLEKELEAQV